MDLKSMLPPSAPAEMAKVFETMEPMEAAIRLEKHGLVADGKSMAVLTGVGLSAYLLTAKVEESQREAVEALERARAAEEAHRKRLEVMKKAAPEAPQ
jgi:flagellar motility protein MotE (MotC chaperone)